MTVSRSVLPTRSPKPFTVPCTCTAPERTAASVFATAHPESLWQWMPSCWPGSSLATTATIASTSCGSAPPFVSQRSMESTPASCAARTHARAYAAFALYPSKKCSASNTTVRPCALRNATESRIMRRFSSSVVSSARVTCSSHVFPTMVATGAPLATRSARPWSSSAATPFLHVEPNAAMRACLSGMSCTRWKNAMSFGFDAGKPPSMKSMPNASKRWTMRSLSSSDNVMPSHCSPSRNVLSYVRIRFTTMLPSFLRSKNEALRLPARAADSGGFAPCIRAA